jgi:hypothetical protein
MKIPVTSESSWDDRMEAAYRATGIIYKEIRLNIIPQLDKKMASPCSEFEKVVIGVYYEMFGWLQCMEALNAPRYFQGHVASARALFELLLDLKLIMSERDYYLPRYLCFVNADRLKYTNNYVEFFNNYKDQTCTDMDEALQNLKRNEEQINCNIKDLWGKKCPSHWSGKNVRERAEKLGVKYLRQYVQHYKRPSWISHSLPAGSFGQREDTFKQYFGVADLISIGSMNEATILMVQQTIIEFDFKKFFPVLDYFK